MWVFWWGFIFRSAWHCELWMSKKQFLWGPFSLATNCFRHYLVTWCHCRPAETPAATENTAVGVEKDLHDVCWGHNGFGQDVQRATTLVHQDFTVPISYCDIVRRTGRIIRWRCNIKVCDQHSQYLPFLYSYCLYALMVRRVAIRVVWRGHNTFG